MNSKKKNQQRHQRPPHEFTRNESLSTPPTNKPTAHNSDFPLSSTTFFFKKKKKQKKGDTEWNKQTTETPRTQTENLGKQGLQEDRSRAIGTHP